MIGAPGKGIEKPQLKKYRVFVQSKGILGVRPLGQQNLVLYEVKCTICIISSLTCIQVHVYNCHNSIIQVLVMQTKALNYFQLDQVVTSKKLKCNCGQ